MNVNLGIWTKLSSAVIFLLFVAGLSAVSLKYLPVIEQNQRYRRDIMALDAKIQEQERVARQLKAAVDATLNDPRTLERLAREKLGYAKSNETVIHFQAPPAKN